MPSLRQWLTREQAKTRRGRAELRLVERAALWTAKPENHRLPAWWEFLNIRCLTSKNNWTQPQRKMMSRATGFHALRACAALLMLAALIVAGSAIRSDVAEQQNRIQAASLVNDILGADTRDRRGLLDKVAKLQDFRPWADELLRDGYYNAAEGSQQRLHASLALFPVDAAQAAYLQHRLLAENDPARLATIRDFLGEHLPADARHELRDPLWSVLEATTRDTGERFCAACALATFDTADGAPNAPRWDAVGPFVAEQFLAMILQNPSHYSPLVETLRPVREVLVAPRAVVFRDAARGESERSLAANLLADYAADKPDVLVDLLNDADPKQFAILLPKLQARSDRAIAILAAELQEEAPEDAANEVKVALAKRRANVAAAMLRPGERERIFSVLRVTDDPESLTQFVHRCQARGVSATQLWECGQLADRQRQALDGQSRRVEDRVLFGLLLALGDFTLSDLPEAQRQPAVAQLATWCRDDPSSAIHGATGWLLRQWQQADVARQVDETPVPHDPRREWFTLAIQAGEQTFYQTYAMIPAGEYEIGSPAEERERHSDEKRHRLRITRPFAILDREITREEFRGLRRAVWRLRGL